ncbi:MAG: low molecular weight protein-tyrosine-phosphatase [Porcipelethomonas sp.]
MIRIMFVCHGNICRSPMAEFIMKKLVRDSGLQDEFFISSSATSTEEIWNGRGNPVYPPAKAELKKHGISCEGKSAVQLKKSDYEKYDYFVGMDSANIRNMRRILGNDKDEKIYKLLGFAGRSDDVADPWYSGDFVTTYRDIHEGCNALLKHLTGKSQ